MQLFTIGHSNHEIASFMLLLKKHNITALADVRSHPYSRFLKHFNQSILSNALKNEGIYYVFLGKELGARPSSQECYVNGKALYEKIAKTSAFNHGIERILQGVKKQRIALMCAEKDPLECHRAILICQHLRPWDLDINHILKNGDLESHNHLEERMLNKHGFTDFSDSNQKEIQLSLFVQANSNLLTKAECLEKAYKLQGDAIAYIETIGNHDEQDNQSLYNRLHSKERTEVL
jgi:hypothetical protein